MQWPEPEELRRVQANMRALSERFGLVLGATTGRAGSAAGVGLGASVEYHDHRPFVLGDDPRYLDWNAYARTGQPVAKMYRAEVTLEVDVVLDGSRSMAAQADKQRRALELTSLAVESSRRQGAAVRLHVLSGGEVHRPGLDAYEAGDWLPPMPKEGAPGANGLERVAFRPRGTRIWISDLLFSDVPQDSLRVLRPRQGRAAVVVPFTADEVEPDWDGNMALVDVESGELRAQWVDAPIRQRYRAAYAAHFETYARLARRHGLGWWRVEAGSAMATALATQGVEAGVFAPWS